MIVKDQSTDLREFFVHHYYHHGIRRFYVYDDGSEPPLVSHANLTDYGIPSQVLSFSYIKPGAVPDEKARQDLQLNTYTRCVETHGDEHTWLAFIDPDEYIEMRHPDHPVLIDWLREWEGNDTVGALAIQWLAHTSNDHVTIPTDSTRKAYTACQSNRGEEDDNMNRHIKSFVRTQYFSHFDNIHHVKTKQGTIQVGEHGDIVDTHSRFPISHDIWALHHYATKSKQDFEAKKARGRVQGKGQFVLDQDYWERYHRGETYECGELARYEP